MRAMRVMQVRHMNSWNAHLGEVRKDLHLAEALIICAILAPDLLQTALVPGFFLCKLTCSSRVDPTRFQPISQSVSQSVNQPTNQSINQINQPNQIKSNQIKSINQSINQIKSNQSNQSRNQPPKQVNSNQISSNQSIYQSPNQIKQINSNHINANHFNQCMNEPIHQ